jgi:hypothetical protein
MRWISVVLDDIEAQHAGLGRRRSRIDYRRSQKVLDTLRPDAYVNMNDQHAPILLHLAARLTRAARSAEPEGPCGRRAGSRRSSDGAAGRLKPCLMILGPPGESAASPRPPRSWLSETR